MLCISTGAFLWHSIFALLAFHIFSAFQLFVTSISKPRWRAPSDMFNHPKTTQDQLTGPPCDTNRYLPPPYNTVIPGVYNLSPLPQLASRAAVAATKGMSVDIHQTPILWQRDPQLSSDIVDVLVECQNLTRTMGLGLFNKKQVRANLIAKGSPGQYHLLAAGSLRLDSTMRNYTLWQLGLTQSLWNYLDQRHAPNTPGPMPQEQKTPLPDPQILGPFPLSALESTNTPVCRPECDEIRTMSNHEDDAEPCDSGRHPQKMVYVCSKCYEDHVHKHVFQAGSPKQRNIMEFQGFFTLCKNCADQTGEDSDDCQCFDHTRARRCAECFEADVLALTDPANAKTKGAMIQLAVNALTTSEYSSSKKFILICPICDGDTDPEDRVRWCAGCMRMVTWQHYTNILGSALPYEPRCAPPGWHVEDMEMTPVNPSQIPSESITEANSASRSGGASNDKSEEDAQVRGDSPAEYKVTMGSEVLTDPNLLATSDLATGTGVGIDAPNNVSMP